MKFKQSRQQTKSHTQTMTELKNISRVVKLVGQGQIEQKDIVENINRFF